MDHWTINWKFLHKITCWIKKSKERIKNNNQKCVIWCHARHINPVKICPEIITQKNKNLVNDLDYRKIKFPVWKEDFSKIETKNDICINVFYDENKLTFEIYLSDQKFENPMDLLLIKMKTSHIMCISKIGRCTFHKTKSKKKENTFANVSCSVLVLTMFWTIIKKCV